jgi:hypothetical protein
MSEIDIVGQITQYGLLGAVLAWFMWRNEKVINKLIEKIDGLCIALTPDKK